MKAIANAIRFVIYSNVFIAFCASAYTAKTSLLLYRNNGNLHVLLLVFCATLFFYCFHRINKKVLLTNDEISQERNSWMSSHKKIYYGLIAISSFAALMQLFYMPVRTWLVLLPVILLGLGYTFPIFPAGKEWKRLRDIYWLKTLWVSFAFSLLTTFLPVAFIEPVSALFKPEVLFIFFRSFLFLFALCIPFDIRDQNFDKLRGVNTLPLLVGTLTSIYIAISLMLIFISLICIQFLYYKLDFLSASALFLSAVIAIILLWFAKPKRPALLFPLFYDGSMFVQWVILFVFMYR